MVDMDQHIWGTGCMCVNSLSIMAVCMSMYVLELLHLALVQVHMELLYAHSNKYTFTMYTTACSVGISGH